MKRVLVLFIVLIGLASCRSYLVQPQQIVITDEKTLERLLDSECFQSMKFEIKVEDVTVEKKLEASPRIK